MRFSKSKHRWLVIMLCAGVAFSVWARELAVGDAVPEFSAKDQFGKAFKLEPGLPFLMLGFERSTATAADVKLTDLGTNWLDKHGMVYVLDIHSMPSVARYFALPKMKKYHYRVVLGETEQLLAPFPRRPEHITVLALTETGKVREIRYWNPATDDLEPLLK